MISIEQIKAARQLLGWKQKDLAEKSGLSLPTIQRMEQFGPGRSSLDNVQKMISTFETAGIEFIDEGDGSEPGGGPGVRLRK